LQSSLGFNRAFIGNRTTVNAIGRAAGASNLLPHDGHHEVLVRLELLTELRHFAELRKEGIVAQIYDLAMCEVRMARAIGDQHVEEEINGTCATFQLEEGDDRDALQRCFVCYTFRQIHPSCYEEVFRIF